MKKIVTTEGFGEESAILIGECSDPYFWIPWTRFNLKLPVSGCRTHKKTQIQEKKDTGLKTRDSNAKMKNTDDQLHQDKKTNIKNNKNLSGWWLRHIYKGYCNIWCIWNRHAIEHILYIFFWNQFAIPRLHLP